MDEAESVDELFAGRHVDRNVIFLCVSWYLRCKLRLRDLIEMMAERGLSLHRQPSYDGSGTTSRSSKRWCRYARAPDLRRNLLKS
jgi:transposase-like protein